MNYLGRPAAEKVSPGGTQNINLDQLIEDRKQEKQEMLKEQLHHKLNIIRDRTVPVLNNEPFPEGALERLKSNSMWEEILSYLTKTSDVMSAYFTCRSFAESLRKRQTLTALPNVLNVLKTKVDKAYEVEGLVSGAMCYNEWNTICLNARGVCNAWKEAVDFHYNISRDDWFLTQATQRNYVLRPNMFTFTVKDEESVDRATSLINESLTVSHVRDMIVFVGDRSTGGYIGKLTEFLKAHGSSVRSLCFLRASPGINPAIDRLGDTLRFMKNLKELHIMFDDDQSEGEIPGGANQFILEILNERQLPVLESVAHFSFYGGETEQFLLFHILRKCINLKSLNLYLSGRLVEGLISAALMGLTLERFHGRAAIFTSCRANWPLKYLEIIELSGLNASVLFPAINRFRETLEYLSFQQSVKMDQVNRPAGLELLHLKCFCISSICRGTLGLDDLLPLKSLEQITIITGSVQYEDENALVKVKRYLDSGEMHNSNVWKCFPDLVRFQIRYDRTYFRPTSP